VKHSYMNSYMACMFSAEPSGSRRLVPSNGRFLQFLKLGADSWVRAKAPASPISLPSMDATGVPPLAQTPIASPAILASQPGQASLDTILASRACLF
jgi:hypothetical protein